MRRMASVTVMLCVALGMLGAAAQDAAVPPAASPETPEAQVKARAESFWTAKQERKLDVCYGMLSKASQEQMTMVDFIGRHNTRILRFSVDKIQIDSQAPDRALVEVLCDVHAMGRKMSNLRNRQQWVREEGVWRCVQSTRSPFDRSPTPAAGSDARPAEGMTDAERQKMRDAVNQIRQKYGQTPSLAEAVGGGPAVPLKTVGPPAEPAKVDGASADPGQTAADGKAGTTADGATKTAESASAEKAKPAPAKKSDAAAEKQKKDPPPDNK